MTMPNQNSMPPLSNRAFPLWVSLVEDMFVSTADKNYMLARVAFQARAGHDFYWLSLHALEKYLKAIRLLNGMPPNGSHDIVTLYSEFCSRFPGLAATKFEFSKAEKEYWRKENVRDFMIRLNSVGSAVNRYGTYGYSLFPDDLAKVDRVVWTIRRCCRPIANFMKFANPDAGEAEGIDGLKNWPNIWQVGGNLPIEKLLSGPVDTPLRKAFLEANVPFEGSDSWLGQEVIWSSVKSPFTDLIHLAKNASGSTQATAIEVLRWSMSNIYLEKADLAELKLIVGER